MATSQDIKGFLAQWLQLGKEIEHLDGSKTFKPAKILGYRGYSQEFESWWHEFEDGSQQWALSGTEKPLSELYDSQWEIINCARCEMPIPIKVAGINGVDCPCHDIPHWPNTDLPRPHTPSDTQTCLNGIRERLGRV